MQNPIRAIVEYLGQNEPLLLSHHPDCAYFDHHTVEVYDQPLCMGCFVVYPVAFLSLVALTLVRAIRPEFSLYALPTTTLQGIGFALVAPLVVGKLLPVDLSARQRIMGKALLAVGLAVLAFPIVYRPSDRVVTAILFVGFLVPYLGYKAATLRDDCERCPEAEEFPNCSGMTFDGTYRYSSDNEE